MFRIVQKYLTKTNTDFHTVPLQEERTLKVVIKRLLTATTEIEVAEELLSLGFETIHVRQFGNSTKKLGIHMVSLPFNL